MIAAKVANALALDWPRDRLEVIVAVDGGAEPGADATAERARAAGADACWSCRAAASSARRTPPCAPRAASCWRSRTPTRCGSPTRCARSPRRSPTREVGYACGQVRVRQRGRHQPGGPLLALRDVAARARVGARLGHRRQRRDLRRAPGGVPRGRPAAWATTSRSRSTWSSAGWRAVYVAGRAGDREDGPHDRGRVGAQAADDEPRVADRPARRAARPARLRAAVRADDRSRTGCCATRRRCCTCSPRSRRWRCCARGRAYAAARGRPGGAAGRRRGRRPRARAPAARGPLLRAHHRRARRRPVRLAAPRHARSAGRRRRARGERRAVPALAPQARARRAGRRRACSCWPRPLLGLAALAIRLESHGHPVYRQRRVGRGGAPFELYKLRTMVSGAESWARASPSTRATTASRGSARWLRRTSLDELPNLVNVLRGEMSLVGPRPTVQVQVDRYSERQRRRLDAPPGHHRLGADQRPRVAAVARADRARPLVPRARLAAARPADPRPHRADGRHRRRPVPRRDRRLAGAAGGV